MNDNINIYYQNQDNNYIFPSDINYCQSSNSVPIAQSNFSPNMTCIDVHDDTFTGTESSILSQNLTPANSESSLSMHLSFEDSEEVKQLLSSWDLHSIVDTCIRELIDVNILKCMSQSQSEKLLSAFPLGIKIKFWNCLEKWQRTLNTLNLIKNEEHTANNTSKNPPSVSREPEKPTVCLSNILNECSQGKLILDYYNNNKKLNDGSRSILVEIIIAYMVRHERPMSIKVAQDISSQIVSAFPTEIKEVYFMRRPTNTSPKGKLYGKYYNSLRSLQKGRLIQTSKKKSKLATQSRSELEIDYECETDINDHLSAMRHNTCSWPDLEMHWQSTIKYRLNFIKTSDSTKSILEAWPNYKLPLGYKLIDIDFKFKFPQCENMLTNYDKLCSKLLILIKEKIKDPPSQKVLVEMESTEIDENGRNACIFYLIHAVLVPSSKKMIKDNNKRSLIKYSIKDSLMSFILFAHTVEEVEEIINKLKEKGDPIQPFVIIIGTILKPKEILVFFYNTKFKLFSVVKTVDICFKIIHLFHLEYPLQCTMVWHFVQKMLYKLETPFDTSFPQVSKIISELN